MLALAIQIQGYSAFIYPLLYYVSFFFQRRILVLSGIRADRINIAHSYLSPFHSLHI